eukprot:31349-Pelagococcus_subviridis.AAC.16
MAKTRSRKHFVKFGMVLVHTSERDMSEQESRANVTRCVLEIRRNAFYVTVSSRRARCSLAQNEKYSYS